MKTERFIAFLAIFTYSLSGFFKLSTSTPNEVAPMTSKVKQPENLKVTKSFDLNNKKEKKKVLVQTHTRNGTNSKKIH